MKILIIGGVAGGATVAARLRRLDEDAQIILFERGEYVSYANCGLPYYIGGVISEREKLFVQTIQGFITRFNIDIRVKSSVESINPKEKTVSVKDLITGKVYVENYDKLVLSPGAEPICPPIKGWDKNKIFTLRNVADTDNIKTFIQEKSPNKAAVVVGGGFIGLEMAENLREAGLDVTVVEMAPQVMAPLDFSMAAIVHQHIKSKKVGLLLNEGVVGFESNDDSIIVELKSGRKLDADMVIWSIGVKPEIELAQNAGLKIGDCKGISVNEYMQTSDENIYALGDAVEVINPITNKYCLIPLAGPANKQGRIVADNIICGNKYKYNGTIGTSIAKVFDLTVAAVGVTAKVLKREGIEYLSSYTHSTSHAGYYPGALSLSIKIVFSPKDGALLGAQVVGLDGVDKRIEMLAQVIQKKGTIYDLCELEQAYAPPFSSAKDPVNMAGFVADNILQKKVNNIGWREIDSLDEEKYQLIDVRTHEEVALGTISGAINIPVDSLRDNLNKIDSNKIPVVFCRIGLRGYLAARILVQKGFPKVLNLSGGYATYEPATRDQNNEPGSIPSSIKQLEVDDTLPPSLESKITFLERIKVDACGLQCPGPILRLKRGYEKLVDGQQMEIKATDVAFGKDIHAWCNMTGAKLIALNEEKGVTTAVVQKENKMEKQVETIGSKSQTMIIFSDDLDKALASFIIANGAAALGKKVTMFFTFWGLNIIKKNKKPKVKKDFFGKMFSLMLPSNSEKLKLSKLNMCGMGSKMMRIIMRRKNIDSLESLLQQAIDNKIEMIACNMSMDVMGVKAEELLDNVTLGGVASFLEAADKSNPNLFI